MFVIVLPTWRYAVRAPEPQISTHETVIEKQEMVRGPFTELDLMAWK